MTLISEEVYQNHFGIQFKEHYKQEETKQAVIIHIIQTKFTLAAI